MATGAEINGSDRKDARPSTVAALWGLTDVTQFLHAIGANLNAMDKRGLTALDTALGLAGGFGFDGRAAVVREETAKGIRELGGTNGKPVPQAPAGRQGGGGRGGAILDDRSQLAASNTLHV